jgi:CHRD domain
VPLMQRTEPLARRGSVTAIALLEHTPNGFAALTWQAGQLRVVLTLTGLAPGSLHPLRVQAGTCQHEGALLLALPQVAANAQGQAALSVSVPAGSPVPKRAIVAVDNGPGRTTAAQAQTIACGPIQMHDGQAFVVLGSASAVNQAVAGVAQLALVGTTLTIRLRLSGLQPGSQHAAHIHAGSCSQTGAVLLPFPLLHADDQGQIARVLTFAHIRAIPTSGWALNVHLGATLPTQTLFDPIACGNVTPL